MSSVSLEENAAETCSALSDSTTMLQTSDVELMKERFAKLLLGEDMSGGRKGICTALAISNAITNLSASVFGELWKLEPLTVQKRSMWAREKEWLLCVSDSIVELIPSSQGFPGGEKFEVMVSQLRRDLYVNLPALKKLDAMLISMLDEFADSEFYYVERGIVAGGGPWCEEKQWLPFPKVPSKGLSDNARIKLQHCREFANQIFKTAVAINNNVLAEMEVPVSYLNTLPKSAKDCLGESLEKYISGDEFSSKCVVESLSEHTTLEMANRIEGAAHFWRRIRSKSPSWKSQKSSNVLAKRAETLLQNLKLHFPALPHTALDITKIQHNKDVGQSILESYSRVMGSLALNIVARINDLLYVDDATKRRATEQLVL